MDWSAVDFEKAANGLLFIITGILSYFGIRRGMRGASESQASDRQTLEVAGALVDNTAVRQLSGHVASQAGAVSDQNAAIRAQTEAIRESSRATLSLKEEVQELRHELSRRR